MTTSPPTLPEARLDASRLEADLAFFEARLSLANDAPDTAYQRAQIKAYQVLGLQLGRALRLMKPTRKTTDAP